MGRIFTGRQRLITGVYALLAAQGFATDPPHVTSSVTGISCVSCHISHSAPAGNLLTTTGNANQCISCHQSGGTASAKPFADANQALPWPGLPGTIASTGTSHRWDASAAGHVRFSFSNRRVHARIAASDQTVQMK